MLLASLSRCEGLDDGLHLITRLKSRCHTSPAHFPPLQVCQLFRFHALHSVQVDSTGRHLCLGTQVGQGEGELSQVNSSYLDLLYLLRKAPAFLDKP